MYNIGKLILYVHIYVIVDFIKLDIVNKENLTGNSKKLIKNYISIGKELSFNLSLKVGDKISIMSSVGIEMAT